MTLLPSPASPRDIAEARLGLILSAADDMDHCRLLASLPRPETFLNWLRDLPVLSIFF